jgi:predicted transcriptional regulator
MRIWRNRPIEEKQDFITVWTTTGVVMRLTTKGRFAVTAMIDLALRQGNGPVTLSGISQRQAISLSYLEQLFGKLRRHEIVESVRGPGGGYSLARDAGQGDRRRHHHRRRRAARRHPVRRQGKLPRRTMPPAARAA